MLLIIFTYLNFIYHCLKNLNKKFLKVDKGVEINKDLINFIIFIYVIFFNIEFKWIY